MAFKIDIEHRGRLLTFGPRFKGEVGKDIFAAKVALGILQPMPTGELEPGESATDISYDPNIPLDNQQWFDCSTGLGIDIQKAAKFDTTLENALLTYQVRNQFLITAYYFEKFGYLNLLNSAITDETLYEAEVLSQITAAQGLFESELRTLGEATIAIMHGWLPATKLMKNTSYTHDERVYSEEGSVVSDVITTVTLRDLLDPLYPQNFESLVESGIAIPGSLERVRGRGLDMEAFIRGRRTGETHEQFVNRVWESNRAWAFTIGEAAINFEFGALQYYPVLDASSSLYQATTQVIDYYLENNLFSQTLSQDEINEQARRAIYPDPFSREDVFIIDGTRLGIYTDTDYFLSADGPLPPSTLSDSLQNAMEEKALEKALSTSRKPEIWYFLKENIDFQSVYLSSTPTLDVQPDHSGEYPTQLTLNMSASLRETYGDLYPPADGNIKKFNGENYWVLTTDRVLNALEEDQAQHWRTIENQGGTVPLISFKEFITPSLRPGQNYRALFEINRQKFELIVDGESRAGIENEEAELNTDTTPDSACLDQNSEQVERVYEEYRAHAIKRRRELVRSIREAVRGSSGGRTRVDLGGFGELDLPMFEGLNIDTSSDYEVMQRVAQLLPGQEAVEWISGFTAETKERKLSNPDNDTNNLSITIEELKERIDTAVEDLKEAQDVINRERIKFIAGTDFNGHNEASELSAFITNFINQQFGKNYKNLSKEELATQIDLSFQVVGTGTLGHKSGKKVIFGLVNGSPMGKENTIFPRPRTNNYLSQIKKMTAAPKLSGFFDDSRNSCKDLGINIDKITAYAYVTKYTSGLKVAARKEEEFTFKSWYENNIKDPLVEYGDTSAQNISDSFDPDNFPEDAALRALGKECDLEKVWLGALDKLDLVSLLCDYIKCIKLPPFDFKAPDFRLPPLPKVPILGWYAGFYKFVRDNWEQILTRLACTASKMIIDKLAFPFCEEQLQDFIQNDLLSDDPYAKQAVIDSLTRTGVPDANQAKDFFDSAANILTGRELCYILKGNMPDDSTMSAISRLANANGINQYLETPEDIVNFFGVVGVYLPEEICDQLNNQASLRPTNCDDTNDLLRGVRNRLQTGDSTLSDEEINRVVAMAEENKQQEADRLKAFLDNGFDGLVPPIFEYGNENAPMSDFPEHFKMEQEKTAESIFKEAKKSYGEGLAQYVPAMYVGAPVDVWPYDTRYDQYQVLSMEAAIEQLRTYAILMNLDPDDPNGPVPDIGTQWAHLHTLYEVEVIKTIPGNLIPEHIKRDLQIAEGTEDNQFPDYVVPHETEIFEPIRLYVDGVKQAPRLKTIPDGVLVHKRRMLGLDRPEDIEFALEGLEQVISRYETRIRRTSGGKRGRLKAEAQPFYDRKTKLLAILEEFDRTQTYDSVQASEVSYEFFMACQQNINNEEFQILGPDGGPPQFGLLPLQGRLVENTEENADARGGSTITRAHSVDFEYSKFEREYLNTQMDADWLSPSACVQYTIIRDSDNPYGTLQCIAWDTVPNYTEIENSNGKKVMDTATAAHYFRTQISRVGDDVSAGYQDGVKALTDRVNALTARITEILTNKPPILDDLLFPGLEELLSQKGELKRERSNPEGQSVESSGDDFILEFKANSVYSPKVTLREITAGGTKDRYDMMIEGDFYIGLDLKSSIGPAETKVFSYCEQLPEHYRIPENYTYHEETVFAKRHRFKNMVLEQLVTNFNYRTQADSNNQDFETSFISGELYKRTTESILESLFDDLSDSYLFQAGAVDSLDRRVVGKRIRSNCVSNRFSFGEASVVSFNKAILGNVSAEIAREMAKPENSPENYDFDSPSAFDLAMQNLAFKGFIRVCLMDILLKGGLAYSTWDLEPIVEERFFLDYAITYVLNELETSSELKHSWRRNIETVTGISNSVVALERLVKQELMRLPNYSKQVFNPEDNVTDFYNWFLDQKLPHFHVSKYSDNEGFAGAYGPRTTSVTLVAQHKNRLYSDQPETIFESFKPEFIVEHYIEVTGVTLSRLYKNALFEQIDEETYNSISGNIILNASEFLAATVAIDLDELSSALALPGSKIEQGSRIVLIEPVKYEARDTVNVGFDPNAPAEEQQQVIETQRNAFLQAIDNSSSTTPRENLLSASGRAKSFRCKVPLQGENGVVDSTVFAIPLASYKRKLDFEDCYSIISYGLNSFNEAVPYMIQELAKQDDYIMLLKHIFPARRLMAMTSVFGTSVVSGYNNMPTIFTPTKSALASLVKITGLGRRQRAELQVFSQEEFVKQLTENFPTDESNCIDFPSGFEDMFRRFFEELFKLIRQMPSIIFRGVANQIDPAYKEMRQHYINCDINHLTYRGLKPAGTADYKLTNGLYIKGREKRLAGTRQDASELPYGQSKGKYVPLTTGFFSDLGYATSAIPNFALVGSRLGISIAKLVTYIYAGNRPFLDPSFYFKIPCMEIDTGAWRDQGKYDAGLFGRYGHPLSPFTLLALATPQLEGDKRAKEANCEIPLEECVELDTGTVNLPPRPREPRDFFLSGGALTRLSDDPAYDDPYDLDTSGEREY